MINLIWLRTFCTLVEIGHFTRTAQQLHMTQSGVSQHINKLEQQLDKTLLLREGKQFSLSEAGEKLYVHGQDILHGVSSLEKLIGEDPAYKGKVRVMSPGSVGLKLYPSLLNLQQRYRDLTIDYRFAPNREIEQAIAGKHADIGLMSIKSSDANVYCEAIAQEQLLLVTPKHLNSPDWRSLSTLGYINHPDGSHHAELLLGANFPEFQHSDLLKNQGFSNQIGLILEPVARGFGFTVLPAHAVAAFAQPELIAAHPLTHPVYETVYLGTHRNTAQPQRISVLMNEIKGCLGSSANG